MTRIILLFLVLTSCKIEKKTSNPICSKKNIVIKNIDFGTKDILSSIFYNEESCYIEKVKFFIKIDERSGNYERINDLTYVIGNIGDSLIRGVIPNDSISIKENKGKKILSFEKKFENPFLDSLSFTEIKTIAQLKKGNKQRILKSDSYFYKNSSSLLGIENSYLDYKAFKYKKSSYKDLSLENNNVDSILITAKTNKFIDDLTSFKVILNDTLKLKFRSSIKADFSSLKEIDKDVVMYNISKKNKNFITFKLNLSSNDLKRVDSLRVEMD